jgi:short-subunit dehydrogenase involved in D-alanine esterification of teichoic acids
VVPWGLRKLLNWIKAEYGNVSVVITENGFSDRGNITDIGRINYLVVSGKTWRIQMAVFARQYHVLVNILINPD